MDKKDNLSDTKKGHFKQVNTDILLVQVITTITLIYSKILIIYQKIYFRKKNNVYY